MYVLEMRENEIKTHKFCKLACACCISSTALAFAPCKGGLFKLVNLLVRHGIDNTLAMQLPVVRANMFRGLEDGVLCKFGIILGF